MGYDVSLKADLGGAEPVAVGGLDANYTYNVAPMFSAAIGETPGGWDGVSAETVANRCDMILEAFAADPEKFRAMNPANGWGSFDGARSFITTIRDECRRAPRAIVQVS